MISGSSAFPKTSLNIWKFTVHVLLKPGLESFEHYFRGVCCCCCQVASVMSDSMQPHRVQPTRLLCPWDFPGKNTGGGCHFLLQCMKVKVKSLSCVRPSAAPWSAAHQAPPSMGFSRQEYWSGVPLPSPRRNCRHVYSLLGTAAISRHGVFSCGWPS